MQDKDRDRDGKPIRSGHERIMDAIRRKMAQPGHQRVMERLARHDAGNALPEPPQTTEAGEDVADHPAPTHENPPS